MGKLYETVSYSVKVARVAEVTLKKGSRLIAMTDSMPPRQTVFSFHSPYSNP
jgi:hypothetical protein